MNPKTKTLLAGLAVLCIVLMSFTDPWEIEKPSLAPVDMTKATIGDGYGERIHPATGEKKMHTGIDFILPQGEQVTATADGVVVEAGDNELRGSYVIIKHNEVYTTSYSHLDRAVVQTGQVVKKKQLIGYVGSTGKSSTGPHLHYEVFKNGENVNPADFLPKQNNAKKE